VRTAESIPGVSGEPARLHRGRFSKDPARVRFRRDAEGWTEPPQELAEGREFVDADVTPAALIALYDDHLSIDADALVAPHVGKWIRVWGPRGTTVPRRRGVTLLRFDRRPRQPFTRVEMQFRGADVRARLDAIPRGTETVVIGMIASVTRSQLVLDRCEVDEANPRSPAGT
jgi:hypothetical protein